MNTILWVGDAGCGSGFGRASHAILRQLKAAGINVIALGINYNGDPHEEPYPIYPCWPGGDSLGIGRIDSMVQKFLPNLVVLQTNPWNVPHYMAEMNKVEHKPYVMGIMAVEGKNIEGFKLNQLHRAVFWTEFGRQEAIKGGMKVPSDVIPLGVDIDLFMPGDQADARKALLEPWWPPNAPCNAFDAFIVGNINRNQHRKRLDLTLKWFAQWVRTRGIEDAFLFMHCLKGGGTQVNLDQLAGYYGKDDAHPHGIQDHMILSEPLDFFNGVNDKTVVAAYRCFDAQINSGLGEGWGLTTMEGMACGVPQIAGDCAALAEWGRDAMILVPTTMESVMPDVNFMIGAFPDEAGVLKALDDLYYNKALRKRLRTDGLLKVAEPRYRWESIAGRYVENIIATLKGE